MCTLSHLLSSSASAARLGRRFGTRSSVSRTLQLLRCRSLRSTLSRRSGLPLAAHFSGAQGLVYPRRSPRVKASLRRPPRFGDAAGGGSWGRCRGGRRDGTDGQGRGKVLTQLTQFLAVRPQASYPSAICLWASCLLGRLPARVGSLGSLGLPSLLPGLHSSGDFMTLQGDKVLATAARVRGTGAPSAGSA